MTAFYKKVKKHIKTTKNAILVGLSDDKIDDLSQIFTSLFIFENATKIVRKKNVIYRNIYEKISEIPDVSAIILEEKLLDKLKYFFPIFVNQEPFIIILTEGIPDAVYCKWLNNEVHYHMTHKEKSWQAWTKIKRK